MRIGIDARLWAEAGNGRYIRNLVVNLIKLDPHNEYYIFLLKKDLKQDFPSNFHPVMADIRWYTLKEQLVFPWLLYKYNLDLVHFPHFNIPIFYGKKFIVTVHDLIHQHHSMQRSTTHGPLIYKIKQWGYNLAFKTALSNSQKIISVSEFSKQQIHQEFKMPNSKIFVTHESVDDNLLQMAANLTDKESKLVLEKFGINPPYIFYVGNAHPHKNVEGLIKTFVELRQKYQYLQLVLAGHDHYFWERVKKEYNLQSIIYTGFVSDAELVVLYKNAKAFIMPSLEEGFGIPLLEAFACSCPVISSNAASLPEVGGEAAIYFDPRDINDMVAKIGQVLNSSKLAKELILKGHDRYREFSWQKLAQQTLDLYTNDEDSPRQN